MVWSLDFFFKIYQTNFARRLCAYFRCFCSQVIYWFKDKLLHERNLPVFHGLFCFFPASKLNHSHLVFFLGGSVKDVEFFGQLRKRLERKNQLNWWIFNFSPLRFGSIFESDECLVFSRYVLKIGVKPIILFRKLWCREHMSLAKKVMATKKLPMYKGSLYLGVAFKTLVHSG